MTREQAQLRATQLNDRCPNGADQHWMAHQADDQDWQVVRMGAAGIHFTGGPPSRYRAAVQRPSGT